MAVKIRLKRFGKMRAPYYRIVVVDSRAKRDGRVIEEIGKYHPTEDPSYIEIDSDRAQYWLSVGAQPTEPVLKQLKITGDWQKFKGLPGQEGTLRLAPKRAAALAAAAAVEAAEAEALKATVAQAEAKAKADAAAKEAADAAAKEAAAAAEAAEAVAAAETAEAVAAAEAADDAATGQPEDTPEAVAAVEESAPTPSES
ncbi:MAG: 30S ribosomal protein S16 [Bifidobacteriaceae bacterium]|nr:30S ribosomal protein S16 [Bifidobacteriaceae bacterium]